MNEKSIEITGLNREYFVRWPNGETKKVMVVGVDLVECKAQILWNEEHAPISGCGCVVGLEDKVPLEWVVGPAQ